MGSISSFLKILLVEGNAAEALLVKAAILENNHACNLITVTDGETALDYLKNKNPSGSIEYPDLILLALNLPKISGKEVLTEIKTDDALKHIPVIVLTISKREEDILDCYNLHANCFINKSLDYDDFLITIASLLDFWTTVQLPPRLPENVGQ